MIRPRKFIDNLLLAVWVLSYAALLRVFGLLQRMETNATRRPKEQNSDRQS